jgi:DedD protein
MEKKKLLLVAISVGVFLVVVIGAAILAFPSGKGAETASASVRPAGQGAINGPAYGLPPNGPAAFSGTAGQIPPFTGAAQGVQGNAAQGNAAPGAPAIPPGPASVDAAEMVRNREDLQGIKSPPGSRTFQENNFYINSGESGKAAVEKREGESPTVIVSVPRPSAAAVPDTPPAGKALSASAKPAPAPAAKPASPAPAKPAAAPVRDAKPRDSYWVQTGSFSVQTRAEGARELLAAKGIASVIENRDMDGKTWFRVRVGPYTSQKEADYWLSLIKNIQGFEGSQVWKNRRL